MPWSLCFVMTGDEGRQWAPAMSRHLPRKLPQGRCFISREPTASPAPELTAIVAATIENSCQVLPTEVAER